jgi:ankyrin repeat protein
LNFFLDVLVGAGADINSVSYTGDNLLSSAIAERNQEFIDKILQHPETTIIDAKLPRNKTALGRAIEVNNKQATLKLLAAGADPNLYYAYRQPPLQLAINDQNTELIDILLKHGADPDIKDASGNSALSLATYLRVDNKLFNRLLEANAEIDSVNQQGETALTSAIRQDIRYIHEENYPEEQADNIKARALIKRTKNINQVNTEGMSYLHIAVLGKNTDIMPDLIKAGIDTEIKSSQGKTALELAKLMGYEDVVKMLEGGL